MLRDDCAGMTRGTYALFREGEDTFTGYQEQLHGLCNPFVLPIHGRRYHPAGGFVIGEGVGAELGRGSMIRGGRSKPVVILRI